MPAVSGVVDVQKKKKKHSSTFNIITKEKLTLFVTQATDMYIVYQGRLILRLQKINLSKYNFIFSMKK